MTWLNEIRIALKWDAILLCVLVLAAMGSYMAYLLISDWLWWRKISRPAKPGRQ